MFCPYCGGQTNVGNTTQAPTVNYGASYTAVKKIVPLKYIVIPVAILAVAAIVITVLVLTLNPGSSQQGGGNFSQGGGNFSQGGDNFSQPYQTEQLTMTVNGENIPVTLSGFTEADYTHAAVFMGKKGTKLYAVQVEFNSFEHPDCLSSNATYNPLSNRHGEMLRVWFGYKDSSTGAEIFTDTFSSPSEFKSVQVSVGEFKPNEKMGLSVTGKVSEDGLNFNFSVSGSLKFYNPNEFSDRINSMT